MSFRRQFNSELAENPLATEIYFSKRAYNNTIHTLQTIFQLFLGQFVRQETTIIDESEEEQELGSTATTLLGLRPTLKPVKRAPRMEDELNPSRAFRTKLDEDDEEEQELDLTFRPQLRPQPYKRNTDSVLDSFTVADLALPLMSPPVDEVSASLFGDVAQVTLVVVNEQILEASLYLTTMIVVAIAFEQMAEQLAEQAEFQQMPVSFRPARTLRPSDFGNPLSLLTPSLQPLNAQRMFSYRPRSQPQPVSVPVLSNDARLEALNFPRDLVPERYKCQLMLDSAMDNPVTLPLTGQVCDGKSILETFKSQIDQNGNSIYLDDNENPRTFPDGKPLTRNPFNNQPMRADEAKPDLELGAEIKRYVGAVEKEVTARRQALGTTAALPQAEYQAIHDRALLIAQNKAPAPQELPAPSMRRR